jgi:hypothetical protein
MESEVISSYYVFGRWRLDILYISFQGKKMGVFLNPFSHPEGSFSLPRFFFLPRGLCPRGEKNSEGMKNCTREGK